jgi:hypothetical protein
MKKPGPKLQPKLVNQHKRLAMGIPTKVGGPTGKPYGMA